MAVGFAVSALAAVLLGFLVWLSESRAAQVKALRARAARWEAEHGELARRVSAACREHACDDSNPRGPWCETCLTVWPCRTVQLLTRQEASNGS